MYRADFPGFVGMAFRELSPEQEFRNHWWTRLIADELRRAATGDGSRFMLNAPTRTLKSFIATVALPAWLLGRDPTLQIACVSGASDDAERMHRLCVRLMSSGRYRSLFGPCGDRATAWRLKTRAGGERFAGNTGRGLGGLSPDVIILDAPQRIDQMNDPDQWCRLHRWFFDTILKQQSERPATNIILTGHRLSCWDLFGHLLRQHGEGEEKGEGGWVCRAISSIVDKEEPVPDWLKGVKPRSIGEPLDPERRPAELLRKELHLYGAELFAARELQSPIPMKDRGRGERAHRKDMDSVLFGGENPPDPPREVPMEMANVYGQFLDGPQMQAPDAKPYLDSLGDDQLIELIREVSELHGKDQKVVSLGGIELDLSLFPRPSVSQHPRIPNDHARS